MRHFWWFSNIVIYRLESAVFHHLLGELLSETFSSYFHQVCPLFALGTLFLREMMVAKMETSWKTQSFAKMEVGNYFLHTLWKNVYTSINLFLAEKKWIFLSLHFLANCKSAKKLQKSLLRLSIAVKTIYLSLKVWVFADFWCPK